MLKIHEIIAKAAGKPLSAEECAELKAMADNSGNHSNSSNDEITRLRNELANAINERDNARSQLAAAARKNQIDALAAKHRFCDPEYLDFLAKKRERQSRMRFGGIQLYTENQQRKTTLL